MPDASCLIGVSVKPSNIGVAGASSWFSDGSIGGDRGLGGIE